MEISQALLLLAAGLAAGAVNAVAGGGSLVTFPTLVAIGLPPVPANVSNSVAVFPGYVASVFGSRADLGGQGRRLRMLLPTAVVGAVAGCALLLLTPARAFEVVVPFLVLGAAALLAFQERLRGLVGHPREMSARRQAVSLHVMVGLGSVYGGYFGAALGVMLVAALALVLDERLAVVNALKNVFSALVGLVTLLVFALFGPVNWAAVVVLTPATLAGGYVGARVARVLPAPVLRALIVGFGTVIGLVLLVRAFA
ncbi:sulfite exporter TauE/SafE family protein [Rhizomonospora bruguierae]|uniref:sulfite exporter TauE/SafE family protein n=1 Tax=Rhizomonospora bruguierae TaxID=1581705 RepID=UPI001BD1AB4F|nr:sulfite exporter TauE/SafE family protein [Micromonospora sp. NBRC 107566]